MKLKKLAYGTLIGFSVFSSQAISKELDIAGISSVIANSAENVEILTKELLIENEDNAIELFELLLKSRAGEADQILASAMQAFPSLASQFALSARNLGISNSEITIAAIEAGIDPTLVSEGTAAGAEEVVPRPTPASPKAPISGN
ncbi:hypothetical protein ACQEXU_10390 [Vibrio sp. TRT 21S02]|uniref:hypothetical protein n=1 Tax=Vibrio sp. TRT 21S02 TaxID=3418507 RepID=UPI003CEEC029